VGSKDGTASSWLLFLIVIIVAAGIGFMLFSFQNDPFKDAINHDRVVNTAFMFEDAGKPIATYVLMFYPATKRAAVFTIPGEIGLILRRLNRVDRIDAVYRNDRPQDFVSELERLLGVEIQYSMLFTMSKLVKMVDLIDGVDLFIPQAVTQYVPTPVLFPSGLANLDGEKACQYLLFGDDEHRIEPIDTRRQRFFVAFLKRLGEKNASLQNAGKVIDSFLQTNMRPRTRMQFFDGLAGIDSERMVIQSVAGNTREVSGKSLLFPHYDGALIKEIVRQTLGTLTRKSDSSGDGRVFTVEVLNGTETAGLAARTAQLIGGFGYDVIKVSNAERGYEKTEIVDHLGEEGDVQTFANVIHCTNIRLELSETTPDSEALLLAAQDFEIKPDITVIIGKDFNGRYTTN
jgi:anionic cell wall polymer biosynthesis LytR-Cps2A-Psr (LCP) family protein